MKKRIFSLILVSLGFVLISLINPTNTTFNQDPDNCLDNLEVPTRFTPDGNDTNDVFIIDFPCQPESFEVQIFDRFGNKVFVDKHGKVEWNGLNKKDNHPCESGIYDWKMAYMYHMRYVERKGQVLLLR